MQRLFEIKSFLGMPESDAVQHTLRHAGFKELTDRDWYFDGIGIPVESTVTFDACARFLGAGMFQDTLQRATRRQYYAMSQKVLRAALLWRHHG